MADPLPPPLPPVDYGDPTLLDHNTRGPVINGVVYTLLFLAGAFFSLRLYCKYRFGHRALWWDDWLLIAAWVILLVDCALLSACDLLGNIRTTLIMTAAAWSKTAFALSLVRMGERRIKWAAWILIVTMNIVIFLNTTISWAFCTPVQKSWDMTVPGTCLDFGVIDKLAMVAGAYSASRDFILSLLPWTILWQLQMKKKEKFGVGLCMSMGIAAGIMASVKTAVIRSLTSTDSYNSSVLSMIDTAEVAVTIMAASIPPLRVFFRGLKSSAQQSYGRSGNDTKPNNRTGYQSSVIASRAHAESKDDDSDRRILGILSKIYRVDEVDVDLEYVSGGGSEGAAFEMQGRSKR